MLLKILFDYYRSDLESASSVACCLQQLCQSSQWQPSITFEITQSLGVLTENSEHPKLENIFGILVFAGFPNVGTFMICSRNLRTLLCTRMGDILSNSRSHRRVWCWIRLDILSRRLGRGTSYFRWHFPS